MGGDPFHHKSYVGHVTLTGGSLACVYALVHGEAHRVPIHALDMGHVWMVELYP